LTTTVFPSDVLCALDVPGRRLAPEDIERPGDIERPECIEASSLQAGLKGSNGNLLAVVHLLKKGKN